MTTTTLPDTAAVPPGAPEPDDLPEVDPPPPAIVSLDLRSLALFRMVFGFVILLDLLARIPEIPVFYTDSGAVPREFMFSTIRSWGGYSLQFMSGAWPVQLAFFLVMVAVISCFIVGYRTRTSAVLAWLLIMSMQGRNPYILHGGDDVIRILMFWCIFAPLNARWSIDAALNRDKPLLPVSNASWGAQALMFQLCFIYLSTAVWKVHPVWLTEGSAIYYALHLTQFAKPFGTWLAQFPHLLQLMTWATWGLEFFGPFLLFIPVRTGWFRLLAMVSFMGLHLGIFLTMAIGLFPWICMAAWIMVMPSMVWDWVDRWYPRLSPSVRAFIERTRAGVAATLVPFFARFKTPPAPRENLGLAGGVFVGAYALIVFAINFQTLPVVKGKVPGLMAFAEALLGLHQKWAMFAPYPMPKDGWYQVVGTQPGGRKLDIWNGGIPPTMAQPDVIKSYRDVRWNKYLNAVTFDEFAFLRPYFGSYLCRSWNASHTGPSRVDHISINYIMRINPKPGQPFPPRSTDVLYQQNCPRQPLQ
ncbi:MAG TPA: HTTM domain-containing protein [Gemmatimonadales bacterium]|jgi:hypothetical protein